MMELRPETSLSPGTGAAYSLSPAWLRLCENIFGYEVKKYGFYSGAEKIGGAAYAVVKSRLFGNRIISMPFSDEAAFWFEKDAEPTGKEKTLLSAAFRGALEADARKFRADYAELRGDWTFLDDTDSGFIKSEAGLRFVTDTSKDYTQVRNNYDSNITTNLKKADKNVAVEEISSVSALAELYPVYLEQMKRFGSPPLPLAYFTTLYSGALLRVFKATVEGKTAAFLSLIVHGGTFYADINAGLKKYDSYFPKIRLFDHTLRLACGAGVKKYDFMRTRPGGGVFLHKQKWGGIAGPIIYRHKSFIGKPNLRMDPDQKRYRLPQFAFRHMPLCLSKAAGPLVRKGLGK
ncbi:MAG: GNAT family N-acetyltransferase [Elusimicrobiales bacterium]|nr:GNAT family N-acetyltransferase [Elusimicrobiales bacterium]